MRPILVVLILCAGTVLSRYHEKKRFDRSVNYNVETTDPETDVPDKQWTFTDDEMHFIAYRDRTSNFCYLERINNKNSEADATLKRFKFQPKTLYASNNALTKLEAWQLAGGKIVHFCVGRNIVLLQEKRPQPSDGADPFLNELPLDENSVVSRRVADVVLTPLLSRTKRRIMLEKREELNRNHDQNRSRRQAPQFRGRFRGQTQSQYLNTGNEDQKEGKAEAEATQQSSHAVVTGSQGMGQAQSMSLGGTGCEDCPGYPGYSQLEGAQLRGTNIPVTGQEGDRYTQGRPGLPGGRLYPGSVPPGSVTQGGATTPGSGVPPHGGPQGHYPGSVPPSKIGHEGGVGTYPTIVGGHGVYPGVSYPGGPTTGTQTPGTTGGYPGRVVPGTTIGGTGQYPGGVVPGTMTGGTGQYPGGVIPGTTTGGTGQYPGGVIPGTTTGGTGQYPGGVIPGTTTGGTGQYPGGVIPGTTTGGTGQYPGGVIPGTTTGGTGQYPGGVVPGTMTGGTGQYPGGVITTTGGTGQYPGGVIPGTTTGGTGQYPGGVIPGTTTGGTGQYPGGVIPGTTTGGTGQYPGGVISGTTTGGTGQYPGGVVPGTTSGGTGQYPGGVIPGATTGGTGQYPGGVIPGTGPHAGGDVTYPGGIAPGNIKERPIQGRVPPGEDGGVYRGGVQPGITGTYPIITPGGVPYPGGVVPPGRTTYPGGTLPPSSSSGGDKIIYTGGVAPGTVFPPGSIVSGTVSTGTSSVTFPGGVSPGTVPSGIYPGGVAPGTTPGGVYPGSYVQGTTHDGVTYPGGVVSGTGTRGTSYPAGIPPGAEGTGVLYPGIHTPGTFSPGARLYPGGSYPISGHPIQGGPPNIVTSSGSTSTSGTSVSYPGGTQPGAPGGQHIQSGVPGVTYPGGTGTVGGTLPIGYPPSGGTLIGYPERGSYPIQGQVYHPGGEIPGHTPGYPSTRGQYPNGGVWKEGTQIVPGGGQYAEGNGGLVTTSGRGQGGIGQVGTGQGGMGQGGVGQGGTGPGFPGQYPSGGGIQGGGVEQYPADRVGGGDISQYYKQASGPLPSADDSADSQASSAVKQVDAGTEASASAQGKYGQGTSQSQVSGVYSGTGSFSAQAGTSDADKSAQAGVSGGKDGATSNAQGIGGYGKSQVQVQLDSESGATSTGAQSSGWNHGTNSQVQASSKGGMADAQANGEGSTSSQAQIGFQPYLKKDEKLERQSRPFRGGGTASAQSGTYRGQSQSQLQGSFQYGITYTGAAQAGSGSGAAASRKPFNFTSTDTELFKPFKPYDFPRNTQNDNAEVTTVPTSDTEHGQEDFQPGLRTSSSSRKTIVANTTKNPSENTVVDKRPESTDRPRTEDTIYDMHSDYEEEYEDEDYDATGVQTPTVPRNFAGHNKEQNGQDDKQQSQMIRVNTGNRHDFRVHQESNSPHVGDVLQPGHSLPGYTIPPGYRGRVVSTAGEETIAQGDGKSQSQTVALVPPESNVTRENKSAVSGTRSLRTNHERSSARRGSHSVRHSVARGEGAGREDLRSPTAAAPVKPSYYTVTNSVAGKMDDNRSDSRKYEHRYYTKSSTCGYFTFSCNVVYGSSGRTKICKPKVPTYADGTPMRC